MDHGLMRRHIDPAVLFGAGQAEHVVILVDGAAYRTQRIMTVGQHIGHGKFLQSRRSGRLYDPHKGNIMAGKLIKSELQPVHISGGIVPLQNSVADSLLLCLLLCDILSCPVKNSLAPIRTVGNDLPAVYQICTSLQ